MDTEKVKNSSDNQIEKRVIPGFSGPTSDGKVFKATPHLINNCTNTLLRSNIITIIIFLCILIGGFAITVFSNENSKSLFWYVGTFLMFFSLIMILVFAISIPHTLSSYKDKMSKMYLEISSSGVQGITTNEDDDYVWFDIPYGDIADVVYNSKQISIYTTDGNLYSYGIFYNPREIYSDILRISGGKIDLKFKTL